MTLEKYLSDLEVKTLAALRTPYEVQLYLDSLPYIAEERNRSPLAVLHDGQAHCYDGALLAAAVLRRIGYEPLLIDLWPEPGMDDDHVLALYQVEGHWGALAKSNYAGLRFREPVYRTLRELVMTYFENFYSLEGIKTLRSYTQPLNLSRLDHLNWEIDEHGVTVIEARLHQLRRYPLLTPNMVQRLSPMDARAYEAGMHGTNIEQSFGRRENL
ncbi:MAG TPA: hypothetical protein VN452_09335 [Longilinea sp.]|nr:hypothetical protein [Longilinea sp.]